MKAIVLLSGGLDSTTALAMALDQGRKCIAISFDYGQRHQVELRAAKLVAATYKVKHEIVYIDRYLLKGSALTRNGGAVPKHRSAKAMLSGIPNTYVPGRNTLFTSYAISIAEVNEADEVVLGINALDYSGYPDCRPEWLEAMQKVASLGTKHGNIRLVAPLVLLGKSEIIKEGMRLNAPLNLTHSCYDPQGFVACGVCDSCQLRRDGFKKAKVKDPTRYNK